MAVITSFRLSDKKRGQRHPTELPGFYRIIGEDGLGPLIQIDTNGSEHRAKRNKQSQTIQLDRRSAEELWKILGKEFGFKP
jgi:hypothetical protein